MAVKWPVGFKVKPLPKTKDDSIPRRRYAGQAVIKGKYTK